MRYYHCTIIMQVSWRRGNFLKAPKFQDVWTDELNRKYMIMNKGNTQWAITESSEWGDNDILAYVRRGKDRDGEENELPTEGDVIVVAKNNALFKFSVIQVFRNVGRTRTVPMVIQPM